MIFEILYGYAHLNAFECSCERGYEFHCFTAVFFP